MQPQAQQKKLQRELNQFSKVAPSFFSTTHDPFEAMNTTTTIDHILDPTKNMTL